MNFLIWFGNSPLASFLRTFLAASLGWVILNADSLGLHPAIVLGLVSGLPVLVSWLNPQDPRFGNLEMDETVETD